MSPNTENNSLKRRKMDRQKDKLIEEYRHSKEGYNPFLIGPKWQVAQLNYMPELAPGAIKKSRHSPSYG